METKRRIQTVERGTEFLKLKRDQLAKELTESLDVLKGRRGLLLNNLKEAYSALTAAYLSLGPSEVKSQTRSIKNTLDLEVLPRSIMGVVYPDVRIKETPKIATELDITLAHAADKVYEIIEETVTDIKQTAVFLTGISYETHPIILEEVMRAAMALQTKQNLQVYIFTGNLKVAQNGLEALYRQSRRQGVNYVKCTESLPEITQTKYGSVVITFMDDISCEYFSLKPDIIIVDETIVPADYFDHLSKVFGLDADAAGFLQTGNVHRTPVFTNVRGILVSGPSRKIQSDDDHMNDVEIASNDILFMFDRKPYDTAKAEISRSNCIRCLTCIRVCPYRSIALNTKPEVMPDACERCGICASKCPRQAIRLEHLTVQTISERVARRLPKKATKTFTPHIIAFCCNRSAVTAYEHACLNGYKVPKGIKVVDIPCGGSISFEHILFTLQSGADGVMIATCHDGNCHGERGNKYARSNALMAQDYLVQAGIEKERVIVTTIAANMSTAFAEESIAFNQRIKEFGPSKLVDSKQ